MGLFKKSSPFKNSAAVLADNGFTDVYIEALKKDIEPLKKPKDIAKGQSYLINALIIAGRLEEGCSLYKKYSEENLFDKLDKKERPVRVFLFCFAVSGVICASGRWRRWPGSRGRPRRPGR